MPAFRWKTVGTSAPSSARRYITALLGCGAEKEYKSNVTHGSIGGSPRGRGPHRLRQRPFDDSGSTAQPRRVAQDRCLLACQPLSLLRDVVPQGRPAPEGALTGRTHQGATAGSLGFGRRPVLYLHPFQPADQQV